MLLCATAPSVVSDELTGITTSPVGSVVNTTVTQAVVPASVVAPDIADINMFATSLSWFIKVMSALSIAL